MKDSELFRKYLQLGLALGGGSATIAMLLRTHALNKKLKKSISPDLERDDETVVVSVPRGKIEKLSSEKTANVPVPYTLAALGASGALSYAAFNALYKKLEDNRMKKLEEEARERAVRNIVGLNQKQSQADLGKAWDSVIDNVLAARNVLAVLAFLGSAAWMKRHLDNKYVDSSRLKPIKPYKIRFEAKEEDGD